MATYYHISLDLSHNGNFSPKVPRDRYTTEDSYTKRVCVSDSIAGCLNAIPDGLLFTEEYHGYFKLFEIETDKLGISNNEIVQPLSLYENNGVYDALLTGEHWILSAFNVPKEKQFICNLMWHEDFSRISLTLEQLNKLRLSLGNDFDLSSSPKELFEELFEYANRAIISDLEERIGETVANARDITDYGMIKSYSNQHQDVYLPIVNGVDFKDKLKVYLNEDIIVKTLVHEIHLSVPPYVNIEHLLIAHHEYLEQFSPF